jgi:hypothetical protein
MISERNLPPCLAIKLPPIAKIYNDWRVNIKGAHYAAFNLTIVERLRHIKIRLYPEVIASPRTPGRSVLTHFGFLSMVDV